MTKNRTQKVIAAYIMYPIGFMLLGSILWLLAGEPVYQYMDAEIHMLIRNNTPKTVEMVDPLVLSIQEEISVLEDEISGVPGKEVKPGKEQGIAYGTQYGTILSPERGLEAPLYYGDDDAIFQLGVGQYPKSVLTGESGTTIIGGHDTTYFAALEDMVVGDEIVVQTEYGEFTYQVEAIRIASPSQWNAYAMDPETDHMILYTCYPFGQILSTRQDRYYVYCSRSK